jgi:prenyltransferase beta subunit
MSLRLEMLQVARLAPRILGDAARQVENFVRSQQAPDGGFKGRDGRSDLYYTSFAIDALMALRVEVPEKELGVYLASFGEGEGLDFIHLCCLLRLRQAVRPPAGESLVKRLLSRVETYRSEDGGYERESGLKMGSVYACLLGYGAYSDHSRLPPRPEGLKSCVDGLRTSDGAWSNDGLVRIGSVPAVAAAVTLLRNLGHPVPDGVAGWLLGNWDAQGGFRAFPGAPMPDLLSTAVALHALGGIQADIGLVREPCLDYLDTLWTNEGGFHGNWSDDILDVEYTYYGLLALGHLAL